LSDELYRKMHQDEVEAGNGPSYDNHAGGADEDFGDGPSIAFPGKGWLEQVFDHLKLQAVITGWPVRLANGLLIEPCPNCGGSGEQPGHATCWKCKGARVTCKQEVDIYGEQFIGPI
jgi:hypothetical protein